MGICKSGKFKSTDRLCSTWFVGSFQVQQGGQYQLFVSIGQEQFQESGTVNIQGNQVVLNASDGETSTWNATFSGNTLSLTLTETVGFDFNNNGVQENATLTVELRKQ